MRPQLGERGGAQVLQPGAAVDQQRLAEHPAPPGLGVGAAIAPPVEDLTGAVQRLLHRVEAEDQVGQV